MAVVVTKWLRMGQSTLRRLATRLLSTERLRLPDMVQTHTALLPRVTMQKAGLRAFGRTSG
ncbi:hypothetical protein GCM10010967_52010 [Dyadobacter beijingensis]|uniref:Uncharacterized protein n=1 Tax=Dyadobacter beijingensis TaxID=365489 RepID=A0ABQ2IJ81_9BACT|nr:hypothetical protein GCM10010967_52010 [Dyadobacter beijingensis]